MIKIRDLNEVVGILVLSGGFCPVYVFVIIGSAVLFDEVPEQGEGKLYL